jgi:dipeptidyl aminopeptidase/acylaminoacyl peptidase
MNTLHRAVLMLMAALTLPAGAAQPPSGLAAQFGAPPQCSHLTLSSSGRMLAWLHPNGSGDDVVAFDVGAHAVRRTLRLPASLSVDWIGWEDDDTLLVDTADTEQVPASFGVRLGAVRWRRLVAFDISSGESHILLGDTLSGPWTGFQTAADLLAWAIPGRPHTVMMAADVSNRGSYRSSLGTMIHHARGDSGQVSALFAVNAVTGKEKAIAYGDAYTNQWLLDEGGNPVARTEWGSDGLTIYASQGGDWRQIYHQTSDSRSAFDALEVDAKAQALLTIIPDAAGVRHLWAIPLNGSPPKRMLPGMAQNVRSLEFDPQTHALSAVWVGRSDAHRIWIDTAARMRYESVAGAFPGRQVRVYDLSRDGGETLAEVQGVSQPPVYYLINFSSHSAVIAGEAYPQLAHVTLGTAHFIQYPTQ